jgi:hypothetical protein
VVGTSQNASAVLPRAGELTFAVTRAIGFGFLLLIGGWALRCLGLLAQLPGKEETLSELGEYRGE